MFVTILSTLTAIVSTRLGLTTAIDSPTCANFELVPCGDPKGIFQWEFCSVTVAKQRITEVYLDIRFVNQRCQKVNFGITTNHQRFWVHQWCYGTFLVCFVPEEIFLKPPDTVDVIDNNSDDNKKTKQYGGDNDSPVKSITTIYKDVSSTRYKTTTDTLAEHNTTLSETETVAMDSNSTDVQTTKTSILLATNRSIHVSETTYPTLTWLENKDRFPLPRISERIWMLVAICVSAGVLLVLISFIVCLTIHGCRNRQNHQDQQLSKEHPSTAHLVTSDTATSCSQERSVYDFIPVDPETGFPSLPHDDDIIENTKKDNNFLEVDEKDTKLNIYNRPIYDVDNSYDVLRTNTKTCRSQSETSTYSHLGDILPGALSVSEDDMKRHGRINHVYAVLVPCDTKDFQIQDEDEVSNIIPDTQNF